MTYCFRCPGCEDRFQDSDPDPIRSCPSCGGGPVIRDYRAEAVGIGSGVRVSRGVFDSPQEAADALLPSNKDFAGPSDPDGTKGMRQWRDSHTPHPTNKRPYWPGEVERKSFPVG